MPNEWNPNIDRERVQHTAEHDFQGGLKKNGSGVVDSEGAQDAVGSILGDGLVYDDASNTIKEDIAVDSIVTLSSGTAVISTGVTTTGTNIDVSLDPSGDGNNTTDVKASARSFWDYSAGEYKVEILEDGTNVGNPDIGYKVTVN